MRYATVLFFAALVLATLSRFGVSAELKVALEEGAYEVNGEKIRFFAFTGTGPLETNGISPQVQIHVKRLTGENKTIPITLAIDGQRPSVSMDKKAFGLEKGEIFVVGFANEKTGKAQWLALDTSGGGYPKHQVLDSSGKIVTTLDSGSQDKTVAIVRYDLAATGGTTRFTLVVSSGWINWFINPPKAVVDSHFAIRAPLAK